jgi:hypothetical protein
VVSVVFPCLNEAGSVGDCVREALSALEASGIPSEVLVVDNGSSDDSAAVALAAGARVISEARPGYGSALRAGIAAAEGAVIVMADADWSYDLRAIDDLVRPVITGSAELVVGNRMAGIERGAMPLLNRYLGNPILTALVRRVTKRLDVDDSQCGCRAFSASAIRSLDLRTSGMEFASEMVIRAGQAGLRMSQMPINYRRRVGLSKLHPLRDGWRHLRLISMLAPQLVLFQPGLLLLGLGLVLSVYSVVSPGGIEIGSLRWQPIFFSTIAITLGVHGVLVGMLLAHRSALTDPQARSRFAFVGGRSFPRLCVAIGACALVTGLAVDALLFVWWLWKLAAVSRAIAYASIAQSLIIGGVSTASFGLVVNVVTWADQMHSSTDRATQPEFAMLASKASS